MSQNVLERASNSILTEGFGLPFGLCMLAPSQRCPVFGVGGLLVLLVKRRRGHVYAGLSQPALPAHRANARPLSAQIGMPSPSGPLWWKLVRATLRCVRAHACHTKYCVPAYARKLVGLACAMVAPGSGAAPHSLAVVTGGTVLGHQLHRLNLPLPGMPSSYLRHQHVRSVVPPPIEH